MTHPMIRTPLAARLMVAAVIAFCGPALAQDKSADKANDATGPAHVLSNAEFDALIAHPEGLLIVDVRRPDELSSIGGFGVYLSIQPSDVEKSLAAIPRERTIVTVSNHASRAIRVAKVLAANGFKVAGTLGAQTYEEQGGKLVKVAPRPAAPQAAAATH